MLREASRLEFDEPTVFFGGDARLACTDGCDPFERLRSCLDTHCLVINLEASLDARTREDKLVTSAVSQEQLDWLVGCVGVANIVNNHASDAGDPEHLAHALQDRGVIVLGPENPACVRVGVAGQTVDLFAACFRLPRWRTDYAGGPAKRLLAMVEESAADVRIVSLHWGYEHTDIPAPFQRHLASKLVGAGADLIVGHHPHVRQGWERIDGVPVFYSLGHLNFRLSSRPMESRHYRGILLGYDPRDRSFDLVPITLDASHRPHVDLAERRDAALAEIAALSAALDISEGDWYRQEYGRWFRGELRVWLTRCKHDGRLWAKLVLWLALPLQLEYYGAVVAGWFGG